MEKEKRVLSIQSHVVSGYVGNKSAVFPLQLLGIDVDIINTVQFSNHTGYPNGWGGEVLKDEIFAKLRDGLQKNNLLPSITHVLQGYCPNIHLLDQIYQLILEMKSSNPEFVYVCDPVMGDNGKLYVSNQLVEMYQQKIIPIAQFITPNQFEAELLTEMKITSLEDAIEATNILHRKGVDVVVITSLFFDGENIVLLGSKKLKNNGDNNNNNNSENNDNIIQSEKFKIIFPYLHSYFTGTGDLFSSLLLGWYIKLNGNLMEACEKAVASIQSVLARTVEYTNLHKNNRENDCGENQTVTELRIIQSKEDIENPKIVNRGIPIQF